MQSELEPQVITVAIATADPLVRSALAANIAPAHELEIVADVARADVVLWDPGIDAGPERYAELASFAAPVVVLSADPEHARAAFAAGARAVLGRDVDAPSLCAALLAVARRLTVLDEPSRARLFPEAIARADTQKDVAGPAEELTARELQVLQLLAAGMSNRAIARELDISEHTAKFHVNGILAKLGASSRTEAVVAAARRALVIL